MINVCKMFRMVDELNVELLFVKISYIKRHLLKVAIVKFRISKRKYLVLDAVQLYFEICCHRTLWRQI